MKDNDTLLGIVILVVLIIIMIITPKGSKSPVTSTPQDNTQDASGEKIISPTSPYKQSVSLGTGNASYSYQAYEEYITLDNTGNESIDITNWKLKNGKGERAYSTGGDLRYFTSDIAIIGQATLFVSPTGNNIFQNIVLKGNERAVITTGSIGSQLPYKIVSFKENICSGYLEDLPEYTFIPPLSNDCPRPRNEPGVSALDTECRTFIESMSSCRTPKFDTKDSDGEICHSCVNNVLLSSACVSFIKNHFNYASCIYNHKNDTDFSGHTWRIFLGRGWEMWAEKYETIELFDKSGKLVSHITY